MSGLNRILVIRPDRMGDVILSTPALDALRKNLPQSEIIVLVHKNVAALLRNHPSVDGVISYDPQACHQGILGLLRLRQQIRSYAFDAALFLQSNWRPVLATVLAGVKLRIGAISQLHTRLFYQRGIRQKRSRAERNEADYNLELAALLWEGAVPGREQFPARICIREEDRQATLQWLLRQGWKQGEPLTAIHPGMGGSALNWSFSRYFDLIQKLLSENQKNWIVLTGGQAESQLLANYQRALKEVAGHERVLIYSFREQQNLSGEVSPLKLAALFSWCSVVVAPSTGPLHLASAIGRRVVGLYSPIRVQSGTRWGPYVSDPKQVSLLSPQVECPEVFHCAGKSCEYYNCMDSVKVEHVLEEVRKSL